MPSIEIHVLVGLELTSKVRVHQVDWGMPMNSVFYYLVWVGSRPDENPSTATISPMIITPYSFINKDIDKIFKIPYEDCPLYLKDGAITPYCDASEMLLWITSAVCKRRLQGGSSEM